MQLNAGGKDKPEPRKEVKSFLNYVEYITHIDASLTPKQELICKLLCLGHSLQEIAKKLDNSTRTIQKHIQHLKHKTKIYSMPALACWYLWKNRKI